MNMKTLNNLQYALKQKGYIICINSTQFYSYESKRFIKVFQVNHNKKILFKSVSLNRVFRCVAGIYKELNTLDTNIDREEVENHINNYLINLRRN